MSSLQVEMISHATLKIRGEFGTLLCDPWLLNEPIYDATTWKFPAAVIPPEEVARGLDYVFISHTHEDHFHIPSIDHLSRDVTLLLPEYDHYTGERARTAERTLRALGFTNIRKLRSWQTMQLGGKTPFTLIPSDPKRDYDWENAGFVLDHPGCKLINLNDNIGDEEHYRRIAERFGSFDIGFIQTTGVSMYPGCFRMDEAKMREEAGKRKLNPVYQKRMIDTLKVKYLAPFAGDFCWLGDDMFHCNWANRTTPQIFQEWFESNCSHLGVQLVVMHPSDTWSMEGGLKRNHPPVDWDNYLESIRKLQRKFRGKIERYQRWIGEASLADLEARSRGYTDVVARSITQDHIDFDSRVRIAIDGKAAGFSFVMKANPKDGFAISWDDSAPVDHTLHVDQRVWAAVLERRLMWSYIQWAGQTEQHVPYRLDIGKFWFWLDYYVDLNDRNSQIALDARLFPELAAKGPRPRFGVFPGEDDWDLSWLR